MSTSSDDRPTLLRIEGLEKSFPGVRALRDGRLDVRAGECHALMGENGAGKSTLIKILSGAQRADAGTIRVDGSEVRIASPLDADRLGIAVIYQELNLVPTLSVRENVMLGRERTAFGFSLAGRERREVRELFTRMGIAIDVDARCDTLTVAQLQCVEIAKALSKNARLIVMDEPTAALTEAEVQQLFTIIRGLKAAGVGVVYVSHRMDEIFAISDRITVMRDGAYVATSDTREITRGRLIEQMVGRSLANEFPTRPTPKFGDVRLETRGLSRGKAVRDVSLTIRAGEIVGLTGLMGSGRTEVARLIFGADRADAGDMLIDGKPVRIASPIDAIGHGICLLTEDRKHQGLILPQSVRENFGLPNLGKLSALGFVAEGRERAAIDRYIRDLRIKVPTAEQLAGNLSGGNQQKVVLAKWLEANAGIVIFDEPTRGIDVGAKFEIYQIIHRLADEGRAILLISSELPEVIGMSDRILVMREGELVGEIADARAATQQHIMSLATRPAMATSH